MIGSLLQAVTMKTAHIKPHSSVFKSVYFKHTLQPWEFHWTCSQSRSYHIWVHARFSTKRILNSLPISTRSTKKLSSIKSANGFRSKFPIWITGFPNNFLFAYGVLFLTSLWFMESDISFFFGFFGFLVFFWVWMNNLVGKYANKIPYHFLHATRRHTS
jgi:hypothetical protein